MHPCRLLLAFLCFIPTTNAQSHSVKINDVEVGFRPYGKRTANFRCKVGMWTPVYVTLSASETGLPQKIGDDGRPTTFLQITTKDSDNLDTQYRVPFSLGNYEKRTIIAYTKPGLTNTSIEATVHFRGEAIAAKSMPFVTQDLGRHYYLTLGTGLENLALLMPKMSQNAAEQTTDPQRTVAWETSVARLPSLWYGYDAVDFMMITTYYNKFLQDFNKDEAKVKALATWVRRGGSLVLSVHWTNQQYVSKLLQNSAWSPRLPKFLAKRDGRRESDTVDRLYAVEQWAQSGRRQPFRGREPIPIAKFSKDAVLPWRVLAATEDGRPLIAQFPYGRGAITVLAFDLQQKEFRDWNGAEDFMKMLVGKLAPRVGHEPEESQKRTQFGGPQSADLATAIYNSLDDFEVSRVSFGWIALLIVVYIVVVGPLDYLFLKRVLKRLELTWITFPATVVLTGALLVLIANSLKGDERRIKQVDVVDFDLRSDLDQNGRPKAATAVGQTWFSILSPRNENYTIGVKPNVAHWWDGPDGAKTAKAAPVSWLGRPEKYGPGAMSRSANLTLFRRPYLYAPNATGLIGVPIPVWSTKSFCASWDSPLPQLPLKVDLSFHLKKDLILSGEMINRLPVDLEDVWILYRSYGFALGGRWKAGAKRDIQLEFSQRQGLRDWPKRTNSETDKNSGSQFAETVKLLMFYEDLDPGGRRQNHMLRRLDLSWRLPFEQMGEEDPYLRDAVVYARLRPRSGSTSAVTADAKNPLPSLIEFGDRSAQIHQETYLRFLIPVRPAGS